MDYKNLSENLRKWLKINQNGNLIIPSNRERMARLFALVLLIPCLTCAVMAFVSKADERLFFMGSAILLLSVIALLLGWKRRFEFDVLRKGIYLKKSLWGQFEKSHLVSSFDAAACELSCTRAEGPYQVRLVGEIYELRTVEDAKGFIAFLAAKCGISAVETISDWPNKTPIHTISSHSYLASKYSLDNNQTKASFDLEALDSHTHDVVFIELWSRKSFLKLLIPFFVFTALAGLIKFGVV
ncbi:hypothetical protein [Neptunomonas marina]|uniref:Uncharacterized protein n=1 Tax=Neptunomonas marina TaxID=1815562 RepID=A0A437Q8S9_9GAMM|nr:hypothetical protein [Neptunomonas marina]RVU30900.1 hypothetical protein EOE65_07740 [Neptunomonas marina]